MAGRRLILLFTAVALSAPAAAAENASAYTKIILDQCQQQPPDPEDPLQSGVWWCEGYERMPVRVAEGDLRFLVSYGADAANEIAAGQTLPAFNTIGDTLEWRLARGGDGALHPFATILRFFTNFGRWPEGAVSGRHQARRTRAGLPRRLRQRASQSGCQCRRPRDRG